MHGPLIIGKSQGPLPLHRQERAKTPKFSPPKKKNSFPTNKNKQDVYLYTELPYHLVNEQKSPLPMYICKMRNVPLLCWFAGRKEKTVIHTLKNRLRSWIPSLLQIRCFLFFNRCSPYKLSIKSIWDKWYSCHISLDSGILFRPFYGITTMAFPSNEHLTLPLLLAEINSLLCLWFFSISQSGQVTWFIHEENWAQLYVLSNFHAFVSLPRPCVTKGHWIPN